MTLPASNHTRIAASPLRYPGGKSWLYPKLQGWLDDISPPIRTVIEPYAGGANFGLLCLMNGKCSRLILCDNDKRLAAFWKAVLKYPAALADRVREFKPTQRNLLAIQSSAPTRL